MRMITIAAMVAISLSAYAVEYTPDTDVPFDIIHMHDTTTWEKVCESYNGVCDVPDGTYQVKLLDRNWNELDVLRDVSVRDSGSDGVQAPDLTAEVCALYQVLDDQSLLGSLSIPAVCTKIYSVGDTGPGGGIVFYVNNGGLNGLEAAPADQAPASWCSGSSGDIPGVDNITGAATPDSNSGAVNTPLIEAVCGASSAAGVAAAYGWPNGQSDGFLPNKEELNLLYIQRVVVGGFVDDYYWSSSESSADSAWYQYFLTGGQSSDIKYVTIRVRAVRAF